MAIWTMLVQQQQLYKSKYKVEDWTELQLTLLTTRHLAKVNPRGITNARIHHKVELTFRMCNSTLYTQGLAHVRYLCSCPSLSALLIARMARQLLIRKRGHYEYS